MQSPVSQQSQSDTNWLEEDGVWVKQCFVIRDRKLLCWGQTLPEMRQW